MSLFASNLQSNLPLSRQTPTVCGPAPTPAGHRRYNNNTRKQGSANEFRQTKIAQTIIIIIIITPISIGGFKKHTAAHPLLYIRVRIVNITAIVDYCHSQKM